MIAARVALEQATTLNEILIPFGLTEELVDSPTRNLELHEAAVDRKHGSVRRRVGAVAELEVVGREIMGVVDSLDAVHFIRFPESPRSSRRLAERAECGVACTSALARRSGRMAPLTIVPDDTEAEIPIIKAGQGIRQT